MALHYKCIKHQFPDTFAEFIYKLNCNDIHNIGYCSHGLIEIKEDIDEMLSFDCNGIVCCYEDNILVGLAVFDADCDKNNIEVTGPYISETFDSRFNEISSGIIDYWQKSNNNENQYSFFPNIKNNYLISFLKCREAVFKGFHITYTIDRHKNITDIDNDSDLISVGEYESFIYLHDNIFPHTYYSGNEIIKMLCHDKKILVNRMEGKLIGYVYTEYDSTSKQGTIDYLGVDENKRKQGIGKTLLKKALNELFNNTEANSVKLCVSTKNNDAIYLYESVGFEIESKYIAYSFDLSRNLEFSGGENPLKPVFSPPPL